MPGVLVLSDKSNGLGRLCAELADRGYSYSTALTGQDISNIISTQNPDIVLLEVSGEAAARQISEIKNARPLPVIGLLRRDTDGFRISRSLEDFVLEPFRTDELELRIRRLLAKTGNLPSDEVIEIGDLILELARCEVTLEGKIIMLTFKEYELLRFLAANRGRVFTRQALLDRVWGYDYFGGDRTVDVHIRRLRSKIEDAKHSFIETVRNVGYRFRKDI